MERFVSPVLPTFANDHGPAKLVSLFVTSLTRIPCPTPPPPCSPVPSCTPGTHEFFSVAATLFPKTESSGRSTKFFLVVTFVFVTAIHFSWALTGFHFDFPFAVSVFCPCPPPPLSLPKRIGGSETVFFFLTLPPPTFRRGTSNFPKWRLFVFFFIQFKKHDCPQESGVTLLVGPRWFLLHLPP